MTSGAIRLTNACGDGQLAHGFTLEVQLQAAVNESVENRIRQRRIIDEGVPFLDEHLTSDDCGYAPDAIIQKFEQVSAAARRERHQSEVIEDDEVQRCEPGSEMALLAGDFSLFEGVDSTLKYNRIESEEYLVGGEVAETFAGSLVEQVLDLPQFVGSDGVKVTGTWEELTEEAVEVLVAAALPRAVRASQINLGAERVLEPTVLGKLGTPITGQGVVSRSGV